MIVFFVGVIWMAVMISDRSQPVADAVVTIKAGPIQPGGSLQADARVFYLRECDTLVSRHLYDSTGREFTPPDWTLPIGGPGLRTSASNVQIPLAFAFGAALIVSSPSYACNWFQRHFWRISVPERVMSFTVTAPSLPEMFLQGLGLNQQYHRPPPVIFVNPNALTLGISYR